MFNIHAAARWCVLTPAKIFLKFSKKTIAMHREFATFTAPQRKAWGMSTAKVAGLAVGKIKKVKIF